MLAYRSYLKRFYQEGIPRAADMPAAQHDEAAPGDSRRILLYACATLP